jgi:plasmid stabilization system protein ParE
VTYQLIIRPAADEDLEEASAWYEKKQPGLGKRFLSSVDATLEKLRQRPDFGIIVHKQLRRANVKRFPYGIFYIVEAERLVIVGVLHARRAPRHWKARLQ